MYRLVRVVLARAAGSWARPFQSLRPRRGSVQGVNSLLLVIGVLALLYFLARSQISDEPVTWIIERLRAAMR